jgi:hypothetical protein
MKTALFAIALAAASCGRSPAMTTHGRVAPAQGSIPALDYFIGRWHAEAENPATKQRFELRYRVEPMLNGTWYLGTGTAKALGLEIHDVWGKDAVTGEIVRTIFDSAKNFGTVRAKGWEGDVLVLEGEVASAQGRVRVRETIRRVDADHFEAVWEALKDGTWSAYSVEKLRRFAD